MLMHISHHPLSRKIIHSRGGSHDEGQHFSSLNEGPEPTLQRRAGTLEQGQKKGPRDPLSRASYVGAEPGIDPRSGAAIAEYSHFKEECVIDVIDYDDQDVTFTRMGNAQFVEFLSQVQSDISKGSENDLPPLAVRWINIGGIDWNVLSSVALRYNLDALALEDILHERGHNHSKADYYPNHLFLRILCHSLGSAEATFERPYQSSETADPFGVGDTYRVAEEGVSYGDGAVSQPISDHSDTGKKISSAASPSISDLQLLPKTGYEAHFASGSQSDSGDVLASLPEDDHSKLRFAALKNAVRRRWSALSGYHSPARCEQIAALRELKKDHRVDIRKEPLFIFLLHNGTVISVHPTPDLEYTAPIHKRLSQVDSILRTSDDASLLVESLVDLVVDRILEVMDEYQVKIGDLEHAILIEPSMDNVRSLHILSGDLIMHKRTLDPIKTMIFGLRKYDLDRSVALHDNLAMARKEQQAKEERREHAKNRKKGKHQHMKPNVSATASSTAVENTGLAVSSSQDHLEKEFVSKSDDDHHLRAMTGQVPPNVKGWFSYKSKVYLADVYDHMDFALSSLDMFAAITENLINYAFNTASYEMNIVMSRLTLVTIIFLPLTLLTGYFGMNFEKFWSIKHSDLFFWEIAIPIMAALIPLFMFTAIQQKYRNWERRRHNHLVIKDFRREPNALSSSKFLALQP